MQMVTVCNTLCIQYYEILQLPESTASYSIRTKAEQFILKSSSAHHVGVPLKRIPFINIWHANKFSCHNLNAPQFAALLYVKDGKIPLLSLA